MKNEYMGKPGRIRKIIFYFTSILSVVIYAINASWMAPELNGSPEIYSHRGLYQTYSKTGLKKQDCTATRIYQPEHDYIENTIPSIRAALDLGADVIEIDVQPTRDKKIVVFHDYRLECKTNGKGITSKQTLAYLKSLDVGYGYTADQGKSFPFRHKMVGMIPTLSEVLREFPETQFVINIKNKNAMIEDIIVNEVANGKFNDERQLIYFINSDEVRERITKLDSDAVALSNKTLKECHLRYTLYGWAGIIPNVCTNTVIGVTGEPGFWLWGWPNRFLQRMKEANSRVVLLAAQSDTGRTQGFYDLNTLKQLLPDGYNHGIWVENISDIGPYFKRERDGLNK